jgi:hypothetical protein
VSDKEWRSSPDDREPNPPDPPTPGDKVHKSVFDKSHQSPPVEERSDDVSRTRLDLIQHAYVTWGRRSLIILILIAVLQILSAAAAVYFYSQNRERQNDLRQAIKAQELRRCEGVNGRHDDGLQALDLVLAKAQREQHLTDKAVNDARKQNAILINAIVPKRDCPAEVKKLGL